jgi:hypothetical protein
MMDSRALQSALTTAARVRAGQGDGSSSGAIPQSAQSTSGNMSGSAPEAGRRNAEFDKFDLHTRAAIVNMPPRIREELLQSLRDPGPEGYRKFIDNYFKRLTEVQPSPR